MQSDQVWTVQRVAGSVVDGNGHPVWLCLLGTFRLLRRGELVAVRSGGKTQALLACLGTATRQGVPRETLLRRLWPESEGSLASNALNNVVHALRRSLSEALDGASPVVHASGYYRLNQEAGVAVDVDHFKTLAAQSEWHARTGNTRVSAAVAEQAVQLYRGDLNHGGTAQAIFECDRLRAICLGLFMHLADLAFDRGDYETCASYALRLLAYDPCREDAHRVVMRCHVRRGERAQALRYYQTVRAILRVEFDAEPEPATTALYEQVRLDPGAV
jgi:DNA-binding SARP family transcriptional activator